VTRQRHWWAFFCQSSNAFFTFFGWNDVIYLLLQCEFFLCQVFLKLEGWWGDAREEGKWHNEEMGRR
jgi:hypothetical protein